MTRVTVTIHERIGNWSRQLRARLRDRPIDWKETRSGVDLLGALGGRAVPVLVVDLGVAPGPMLEDLDRAIRIAPDVLALVLDPEGRDGAGEMARELGATLVLSGFVPPPEVALVVDRWVDLAARRAGSGGWSRRDDGDDPLGDLGLPPIMGW